MLGYLSTYLRNRRTCLVRLTVVVLWAWIKTANTRGGGIKSTTYRGKESPQSEDLWISKGLAKSNGNSILVCTAWTVSISEGRLVLVVLLISLCYWFYFDM